VLAGTLHGIHAITSRLSPTGPSSGAQVIEGESFKMNILLTATGKFFFCSIMKTKTNKNIMLSFFSCRVYVCAGLRDEIRSADFVGGTIGGVCAAEGVRNLRGCCYEEPVSYAGDAYSDGRIRYADYCIVGVELKEREGIFVL
jgi:Sybindin-like family